MKTYFNDLKLLEGIIAEICTCSSTSNNDGKVILSSGIYDEAFYQFYLQIDKRVNLSDNAVRGLSFVNRVVSPPRNSTASSVSVRNSATFIFGGYSLPLIA